MLEAFAGCVEWAPPPIPAPKCVASPRPAAQAARQYDRPDTRQGRGQMLVLHFVCSRCTSGGVRAVGAMHAEGRGEGCLPRPVPGLRASGGWCGGLWWVVWRPLVGGVEASGGWCGGLWWVVWRPLVDGVEAMCKAHAELGRFRAQPHGQEGHAARGFHGSHRPPLRSRRHRERGPQHCGSASRPCTEVLRTAVGAACAVQG